MKQKLCGKNLGKIVGMAQGLLLDKLDADWKFEYDFSKPMIDLIYEHLGL